MSASANIAGSCAVAMLYVACLVGPLVIGGTPPLAMAGLYAVMAITICIWAVFLRPSAVAIAIPLAWLVLPCLQLVPLPAPVLDWVAPASARAWNVAHNGIQDAWGRVSIDPAETAAAGQRGLLAVGTIAAVAGLAATPRLQRGFIYVMAMTGAVVWILGLAFPVKLHSFQLLGFINFQGPLMPGRTPLEAPVATAAFGYPETVRVSGHEYAADSWVVGDGFGPYLVSNHFAGALVLTIAFLAAGWLDVSRGRVPLWLRQGVAFAIFTGALATIAGFVKSRAGAGSFVLAVLVYLWCATSKEFLRKAAQWMTILYVACIACFIAALFGSFSGIQSIFPSTIQPGIAALLSNERVIAAHAATRMFLASPLLENGLGTYGALYPSIIGNHEPWYFAHNEYAQLVAEAGIVGAVLAMSFVALLGFAAANFYGQPAGEVRTAGAAAWAAVAGITMHSCFDWNLRVPANAFLACVAAGVALATARSREGEVFSGAAESKLRPIMVLLLIGAVVVGTGFLLRDIASELVQRRVREAIVAARLHAADAAAPSPAELLTEAIELAERMAVWDPGDAQLAVGLGQAHLHRSALPLPIDEAEQALREAGEWFGRARLNCAVCRGCAKLIDLATQALTE